MVLRGAGVIPVLWGWIVHIAFQAAEPLSPLPHLACKDWDGWTVENNPLMLVGLFTFTVRPLQHLLCWCAGLCQELWDACVVQTLTSDTEVQSGFVAESCWNCLCFWGSSAYCCCLVCLGYPGLLDIGKPAKFSLLNPLLLHTLLFWFVLCTCTALPYSPLFLQCFCLQKRAEERKQVCLLAKSLTWMFLWCLML